MNITNCHEMSLGDLNEVSTERDISEITQKHLKKDGFFVTSLKHLNQISKMTSRAYRDISGTSQKHLLQVFLIFQKYRTKMVSCNIRRIITICDKINVRPLETIKRAVHQFQ